MAEVDYILVGQGLAGSAVALQLLRHGRTFVTFDNPNANNSSRIAAGLFNPITGKKMVKTWLADTLFPYLREFYQEGEQKTGARFFYELPLYRPFLSIEEQNEWMARSVEPAYAGFVERVYTEPVWNEIKNPYGGLKLRQCGFVDTQRYILAVRSLIERQAWLEQLPFDPAQVVIDASSVRYGDIKARKLIFCSGTHDNKWFGWLPIRALKGETISVKSNFSEKVIVNRGVYMVPGYEAGSWRVGSTYNYADLTEAPTSEGRGELQARTAELLSRPFEVIDHQWGFRPTTPDRRPILGSHPSFPNIVVFNGLGTKGVSLAPYFSQVLIHWLENRGELHKEVDIERFKSLYWGSPE